MIRRVMAKKDRFPDAYSSGFPPNEESEGSGCSGRDHTETSGYENSVGPKKKWIKLSSAFHDGFGVPIRCVPLSTLPSSDKQKWLLRLRSELDQVRTFQKKVDTVRTHVPISSSSNIKAQTNTIKQTDPQVQKPGRFQSVNEPPQSETFSLILKKQCDTLLKKLMTHQHGWVFNKPVDVVALKIPDYFNVIKKPMDLGTVKGKLGSGNYSSPFQFVADVRLTFSNAMTYNPPGNDVHIMADILSKFFELRWKPIEKKLSVNNSQKQQQQKQKQDAHEVIDLAKPNQISKKRKVTSIPQNVVLEKVNLVMTSEEKLSLTRELETHLGDLPDNIVEYLKKHGSNGETGEDEIEIDIDALNDESLFQLRKMLDDHSKQKQNHAKSAEPCVIELLNESGLSNSTMQLYKGNDIADEDVNEPPVSSNPPIELDKGSDNAEQISNKKPNSMESESQKDEGDKLYRAALLKNRFADTILKAREKTLNQDEKADPEKLRREKELLEDQKRKEKARLQAEAKAAEDARRKVEAEAAAEAKRKRDVEREAARQALLKMEKTVEIDESSRFLKDLEMLPSSLEEISPEGEMEDGLGSFKFGSGNALEQLGLYMKRDDDDEHDDVEETEELEKSVGVVNNEVEEGEIN